MPKIKIDSYLYNRIEELVDITGYSSIEEFVTHIIERELTRLEKEDSDGKIQERLQGLGYIE